MTWKVFAEMSDIMKDKTEQEQVDLEAIDRANQERLKIKVFEWMIQEYLRNKWISIDKLKKDDLEEMTSKLADKDKYLFIKQVVKWIETNYWKPIQRVKENHKCVLFN